MSAFWSYAAYRNALILKKDKFFLPQISPVAVTEEMRNKTEYPEFIRLSGNYFEYIQNSALLFSIFEWHSFLIIHGDGTQYPIFAAKLTKLFESYGSVLVNTDDKDQMIPENYTREDFEEYKHFFENIRDTKCRIILLLVENSGMILEGLYDVGLRKDDVIIVGNLHLHFDLKNHIDEKYFLKRREIFEGAMLISLVEFEGEYGKKVKSELKKKYNRVFGMCLCYDAFITVDNSIKYLISKGEDYENPELLMNIIRSLRFTGCSGEVYFSSTENYRNKAILGFSQFQWNLTLNDFDLKLMATFDKSSPIASKILSDTRWPTGEDTRPENFRADQKCVFNSREPKSKIKMIPLYIFSIIYLLIALIAAFFSYRNFKFELKDLHEKIHPSYQDQKFWIFFIFEYFQIFSLVKKQGIASLRELEYIYFFGFDLITFFDFRNDNYWKFLTILLGFLLGFIILSVTAIILKRFRKDSKINNYLFEFLVNTIQPLLGHFLFMPICQMVLSVYRCEEAINENFLQSFFYRDCTQFCYKDKHQIFIIATTIIFVLYLALAIP